MKKSTMNAQAEKYEKIAVFVKSGDAAPFPQG